MVIFRWIKFEIRKLDSKFRTHVEHESQSLKFIRISPKTNTIFIKVYVEIVFQHPH